MKTKSEISATELTGLIDGTWPSAQMQVRDGWTWRASPGAGNRVNAATATQPGMVPDLTPPLLMIRAGEAALDAAAEAAGYAVKDPTLAMEAPLDALCAAPLPPLRAIPCDAPLAVMEEIWQGEGINAARLAVMARARGPKSYIMGRLEDRAAGCGFVAITDGCAVLHALYVATRARRAGLGRDMTLGAARWAAAHGADRFVLLVTEANAPARALYTRMGFTEISRYHYRIRDKDAS
ncbi:ribosomal protein S18 acetylase RimI-like enzyme [Rubricella aquisinus]|uniref:Ribosomal protein S18 acetylase RimI-like enzyme n=1 Tax=Rubricella aquisinus TaxID=2028108 RepID=A0A840WPP1_9RHOB|nr:GNAT family N-acetyltransferase [Rubricella aquisinus]MBB5517009.1 ribosomal protein S18 acetylase RimI-like enzyme [Rubricella aquisinus]